MKRIFGLMILAIAVAGCQKAPESTRIGSANTVTPSQVTAQTGIQFNGIVTTDASYQQQFNEGVRDFMEWSIDRSYVGTVSATGGDSGVFAGGRIELANGQPLSGVTNGQISIAPNSQLAIAVYDKFSDQANLAPLPARVFSQATGYVSGNSIYLKFSDAAGYVMLQGTFSGNVAVLKFSFDVEKTWDGKSGYAGTLGDLRVSTCSFFRCK